VIYMKKSKIVKLSHDLLASLVKKNDIIIDATLGNGYDSLFISELAKEIIAFDIQEQAIINSKETLKDVLNVSYILDSHEHYQKYVKNYHGVIFNLGYLPTGDKQITTTSKTTIDTLYKMILDNLARFILVVVYPRHLEGQIESRDLLEFIKYIPNYSVKLINYDEHSIQDYIILLKKGAI